MNSRLVCDFEHSHSVLCSYLCLMEKCASSVLQSDISGRGVFKSRGMCFVVPGNEVALTVLHVVLKKYSIGSP